MERFIKLSNGQLINEQFASEAVKNSARQGIYQFVDASGVALPTNPQVVATSPVTRAGVDLSLIGDVSNIVPTPSPVLATAPNATFVAPAPAPAPTGAGRVAGEIRTLQDEIKIIEDRMAGRATERTTALQGAGVFDDIRRLNELNATLRAAQDRQIEIPIEQRQALRGRGATLTEFAQATRPELETAALEELTASRASARLTDAVNTNIQVIDTKLKAEAEKDTLIYNKKQDYLKTLETSYANILTEQQKLDLEDRKFANELTRDAITAERNAKQKQLDLAAERGATPAELNRLFNSDLNDIYGWNSAKALELGDNAENIAVQQSAVDIVGLIDDILANETGLKSSVGSTKLGQTRGGNVPIPLFGAIAGGLSALGEAVIGVSPLGDKITDFRGSASKLVADAVLQNLIDVKAKGATFGALSESELAMLERAATELRPVKKDGEYTGQFAVSEEKFKNILDIMQTATMKTYIASRIGQQAYKTAGYINSSADDVRKAYQALLQSQPSQNAPTNFYQQDLNPTLDVIRREEGFSPSAYQDSTGKWTIGYGNTDINGVPVKRGDTISREEGEKLLRDSVVSRYSTGVQAIGTEIAPNKQAALVSFEYNLGPGVWQTPTGKQILSLVSSGNYAQAGSLMQQYNKSRNAQTGQLEVNPVLVARRAREAALLLG